VNTDTISQCPSPESLLGFVRHELSDTDFESTSAHIEQCSRCAQLIQQLSPQEDSVAEKARSALARLIAPTTIDEGTRGRQKTTLAEVDVGQTLGDFHLVQRLGEGSFAKVFLARQESLQWLVALKVTKQKSDEAPALARLDHDHIVRIHGQYLFPEQELLLVSTKYVPGGTLDNVIHQVHSDKSPPSSGRDLLRVVDRILDTRGESSPAASAFRQQLDQFDWTETVCWLGAKLAAALEHAHQRDVLHRDIKPANVLLSAEGSPMLADFNISFSSEVKGADAGTFFGGSLLYMSPEQLEACNPAHSRTPDDLDGRSDVYSLGLLLWELLTGKHPFIEAIQAGDARSHFSHLAQIRRQGVPDSAIERLPKETSPGLKHALLKCLEPEPSDRFADAGELAGTLEKQLVPRLRELLFPPDSSWRNFVVRHPLLSVTLVGLIPSLLLTPVNIILNVQGIIHQTSQQEQDAFWERLMPLVNGISWPLPILLLVAYAWPMLRALKQFRESNIADKDNWIRRGGRTLQLGLATAVVVFVGWLVCGIAFPWGVDIAVPEGKLGSSHYVQFIVSQAMHALVAASGTYFLVTFLCVRAIYPRLIPHEPPPNNAGRDLAVVRRSNAFFMGLLGISPLLAILALATIFWDKSPELRFVFVWLAVLGEIGFLVAWTIGERLKPDLKTLRVAVQPGKDYDEDVDTVGDRSAVGAI